MMEDPDAARRVLGRLFDEHSVAARIDDFGLGASSVRQLHRFPGDAVKLDRSFVVPMLEDEGASDIVKAIVALAHNLGMEVIAEGVETQAHLDRLKLLGCEYAQGFYIAGPARRGRRHRAPGARDGGRDDLGSAGALLVHAARPRGPARTPCSGGRRSRRPRGRRRGGRPRRSCGRRRRRAVRRVRAVGVRPIAVAVAVAVGVAARRSRRRSGRARGPRRAGRRRGRARASWPRTRGCSASARCGAGLLLRDLGFLLGLLGLGGARRSGLALLGGDALAARLELLLGLALFSLRAHARQHERAERSGSGRRRRWR